MHNSKSIKTKNEIDVLLNLRIGKSIRIKGSEYTINSEPNLKGYKSGVFRVVDEFGSEKCLKLVVDRSYEYSNPKDVIINNRKLSKNSEYFIVIDQYELVEFENIHFCAFIEDWVDGDDLNIFIENNMDILTLDFLHSFAIQMCDAAQVLRNNQLQHGDLHHGNIMIAKAKLEFDKKYTIKIVDFGSVRAIDADSNKSNDDYMWLIHHLVLLLNKSLYTGNSRKELDIRFRRYRSEMLKLIHVMIENKEGDIDRAVYLPEHIHRQLVNAYLYSHQKDDIDKLIHPFDYMSSEHIANDKLFRDLYIDTYPRLKEVYNTRTPTIFTGTRGCGKSSLLRRYSLRLNLEDTEMLDKLHVSGFYIPLSSDFRNKFGYIEDEATISEYQHVIIHYFNLLILKEVVFVLKLITMSSSCREYFQFTEHIEKSLYDKICEYMKLPNALIYKLSSMTEMGRLYDIVNYLMRDCYSNFLDRKTPEILTHGHFIKDLSEILIENVVYFKKNKIAYLLDDYSRHRVSENIQKILTSIVLDRQDSYIFKISAEKYGVYKLFDSMFGTSPTTDESREYDEFDITEQFTDLKNVKKLKSFVVSFLDNRMALAGYRGRAVSLIGETPKDNSEINYSGLTQITNIFSGDTSVLRLMLLEICNHADVKHDTNKLISGSKQDIAIKNVSSKFCEHVKVFRPYGTEMYEFLKKFGEFAQRKYKNSAQSKPRIECHYEKTLSLSPKAFDILEELLRRGVFIRLHDSSALRTGGATLRLHLRRIYNPNFQIPCKKDSPLLLDIQELDNMLLSPDLILDKLKENPVGDFIKEYEANNET